MDEAAADDDSEKLFWLISDGGEGTIAAVAEVMSNISLSVALLAEDDDAAAAELDNSLRFVVRAGEDSFPNLSDSLP